MPAAERRAKLMKRATYASITVALLLISVKLAAWLLTSSVSVLSSLIDSLLDIAASMVNLLAVHHAVTPADREHRFGHGKAEPLAGLAQAAFIAGSAAVLLTEAWQRFIRPAPIDHSGIGIGVMVFSIAVTILLVRFQRSVVRFTGSLAISADELHYRGDLILNGSVILALVLSGYLGWEIADPLFGGAIALWILYNAWRIIATALTQLMDREIPDEERAQIRSIASSHPEVLAVHDLKTRASGPTAFVQLHIEMDGGMTLAHAHVVSEEVEARIREAFPNAEIIIHQDPAGIAEERQSFPAARRQA